MFNKVIVTGSEGFVGSVLCKQLLRQGFFVKCYDLNIGSDIGDALVGDVDDRTTIVHLAAFKDVFESAVEPEKYIMNNVAKFGKFLFRTRNARHIFISSAAAKPCKKHEDSIYGITKKAGETIVSAFDKYTILRPENIIGKGMENGLSRLKNDSTIPIHAETSRDYILVEDLCKVICGVIAYPEPHYRKTYEVGTGFSIRTDELFPNNPAIPLPEGRIKDSKADISKMTEMNRCNSEEFYRNSREFLESYCNF